MIQAAPRVLYVLPATSLHGGNRVVFEHAEGLAQRGYRVQLVSPEPPPTWHPVTVPYRQLPIYDPGALPGCDIAIGTFFPTVGPAFTSGAGHVFHFCQGYEGVHREYAGILDQIDAAYRLPIPKLLVSAHLEPILVERYGCRCHVLGQALDLELFSPGPEDRQPRHEPSEERPLVVGVVGSWGIRSKGIPQLLEGLRRARERGFVLEVRRASSEPMHPDEAALGVTDVYHHHLPTAEMPSFYRGLDAYLFSSFDEEGFPLPPLEAMACGVPVALTDIRGFRPIPGDAVLRFTPGEPEAVVEVIARLADPRRRRRLRRAGLAHLAGYTLEAVLDRLERAFEAEGAPTARR